MTNTVAGLWPWFALAALGFYHGINPAMGWLFAVALGLHRKSQKTLFISLIPIAFGHAASAAVVLGLMLMVGLVVDGVVLMRIAAAMLIAWALFHIFYGHRRRPVVGMQTGLFGLATWSFVMASAHGAGLMLMPAIMPLCGKSSPPLTMAPLTIAIAALALHTAVMLATIALVSALVYNWIDIGFLRRCWINLDFLWVGALLVCGGALMAM
jgi:hypothetical protein